MTNYQGQIADFVETWHCHVFLGKTLCFMAPDKIMKNNPTPNKFFILQKRQSMLRYRLPFFISF